MPKSHAEFQKGNQLTPSKESTKGPNCNKLIYTTNASGLNLSPLFYPNCLGLTTN